MADRLSLGQKDRLEVKVAMAKSKEARTVEWAAR